MSDKTQLAILAFSAESKALFSVLLGATAAMVTATLLAVALGGTIAAYVPARAVHLLAGAAFIVIGVLMLWGKL